MNPPLIFKVISAFPGVSRPRVSTTLLLFVLGLPVGVGAQSEPGQAELPREATLFGDYFGAGGNLEPGSLVEGDAFIAGGQVVLQTPVAGDALLTGARIDVAERVGGDLYATGGSVQAESSVGGNARLAGATVELGSQARVDGKATLAGGTVRMLGRVDRQLAAFGETVTLDGQVGGNVTVAARRLVVGPNARIGGKLTFRGPQPAVVDPAAVVSGGITNVKFDVRQQGWQFSRAAAWGAGIAFTIGLFLIGMLGILLLPLETSKVALLARGQPFASLAMGFAVIFGVPLAAFLLVLTVVGIPVAFVLMLGWPLLLVFGYLTGVMTLTDALAGASRKRLPGSGLRIFLLALGLAGMLASCWLPVIGWVVGVLLMTAGVGAMVLKALPERAIVLPLEPTPVYRQEPTFRM